MTLANGSVNASILTPRFLPGAQTCSDFFDIAPALVGVGIGLVREKLLRWYAQANLSEPLHQTVLPKARWVLVELLFAGPKLKLLQSALQS
jgi:hypothetical protein